MSHRGLLHWYWDNYVRASEATLENIMNNSHGSSKIYNFNRNKSKHNILCWLTYSLYCSWLLWVLWKLSCCKIQLRLSSSWNRLRYRNQWANVGIARKYMSSFCPKLSSQYINRYGANVLKRTRHAKIRVRWGVVTSQFILSLPRWLWWSEQIHR